MAKKTKTDNLNEVDIAMAFGLYLDANGNIDETASLCKRNQLPIRKRQLRVLEGERYWKLGLDKANQRMQEDVIDEAVERRRDQLTRLRNVKVRLYRAIIPEGDPTAGLSADSMEKAAGAMVNVIKLEREITGDDKGVGPSDAADMFAFLRERMESERRTFKRGLSPDDRRVTSNDRR